MDDDIVQKFLKRGKLLTPEALKELAEKGAIDASGAGLIISMNSATAKPPAARESVQILKNTTEIKEALTAEDFAKFYKSKYDKMKNIIASRVQKDFVSLNKLDGYRDEVYTIGMIRTINEKDGKILLEIEDPTAMVPIVFEKEVIENMDPQAEVDDVIAVRAVSAKNVMFGKQIIYPDVPLRQPTLAEGRIVVVPSLHLDEAPNSDIEKIFSWIEKQDVENIFFVGDVGDITEFDRLAARYCYAKNAFVMPGEKDSAVPYPQPPLKLAGKNITSLSNPAMVEINGVKILMSHSFGVGALKKRYLGRPKRITTEDSLVLDELPDIVLFNHYKDHQVMNYKATTIVNPGSVLAGTNVTVIDLATRDAQKVPL